MAKTMPGTVRLLLLGLTLARPATAPSSDDTGGPAQPCQFSVHDTDGDGYLNREEYEVFYQQFQERHRKTGRPAHRMARIMSFEQIDSGSDGRVSLDELVSALRERRQGPGWHWPK